MATKVELRQLQKITTEALLDILLSDGVISAKKMKAGITDAQLAFLNGVTGAIQTQLNEKLSQSLLGKDGSVDWNSDLQIATAKAIAVKIASEIAAAGIAGTMAFKGNWSAVPAASTLGYTYVYDSGTPPTGLTLEVGDMLIAAVDNANINIAAHWTVVQANISGAVTGVETAVTDGQLVVFNGSGGKSVKKSTVNGLLKAVNGVISAATESDLPAHNHNIVFELEGSTLNATTAEAVKIKGVGATTVKSDGNQININTPLPTPVNITAALFPISM